MEHVYPLLAFTAPTSSINQTEVDVRPRRKVDGGFGDAGGLGVCMHNIFLCGDIRSVEETIQVLREVQPTEREMNGSEGGVRECER